MSTLPNADKAIVDARKITHYLLVAEHPDNGGKARFFTAGGFGQHNAEVFRTALQDHPVVNEVLSVSRSEFGAKDVVQCSLVTPDGRNPCVVTAWIDDGAGAPRFVTAYPAGWTRTPTPPP